MQLENGANPFSQDNEGNSVFHEAAENGVDDVLEILFEYRGISNEISSIQSNPFQCMGIIGIILMQIMSIVLWHYWHYTNTDISLI